MNVFTAGNEDNWEHKIDKYIMKFVERAKLCKQDSRSSQKNLCQNNTLLASIWKQHGKNDSKKKEEGQFRER